MEDDHDDESFKQAWAIAYWARKKARQIIERARQGDMEAIKEFLDALESPDDEDDLEANPDDEASPIAESLTPVSFPFQIGDESMSTAEPVTADPAVEPDVRFMYRNLVSELADGSCREWESHIAAVCEAAGFTRDQMHQHVETLKARRQAYHLREGTKNTAATEPANALLLAEAETALEQLVPGALAKLQAAERFGAAAVAAFQQDAAEFDRLEARKAIDADEAWELKPLRDNAEKSLNQSRLRLRQAADRRSVIVGEICSLRYPWDPEPTTEQAPDAAPEPVSDGNLLDFLRGAAVVRHHIGTGGIETTVLSGGE